MRARTFGIVLALAAAAASASGKTVKVSEFGYDPADSTRFIKAAIESDADTVVFDRQSGPWFACSMRYVGLKGKKLFFEKGVEMRAKPGEFKPVKGPNICLFSFFNCTDCVMSGYGAPFSLLAGADSYEKASVRLTDPSGKVCWEHPLLIDWQRYQGAAAEGVWKLDLNRPRGMSRTVRIDLSGVPGILFLSAERRWF